MESNNKFYEEIFDYLNGIRVIDTHEHIPPYEDQYYPNHDFLTEYISHYFGQDLISSGLSRKSYHDALNTKLPINERWQLLEPYWEYCRHTGYGRHLDITVRNLYGIDEINSKTIEKLSSLFSASFSSGKYRAVLSKAGIIKCVLDPYIKCDKEFFAGVCRHDSLIFPKTQVEIDNIEEVTGIQICCFDDYLNACSKYFDYAISEKVCCFKITLAYERSLFFPRVSYCDAEKDFNDFFLYKRYPEWDPKIVPVKENLQNYMMHYILQLANKKGVVYQIHTGLQAGNGNHIGQSDPILLSNLFLEYPNVKFDIFHIGYPFQNHLSALAKNFPNVFIDMCWANIISPSACISALDEWIDSVPINKIMAFGGDSNFIDVILGHLLLAKSNISRALSRKVADSVLSLDEAKKIAKMLFYDNPKKLFGL